MAAAYGRLPWSPFLRISPLSQASSHEKHSCCPPPPGNLLRSVSPQPSLCTRPQPPGLSQPRPCPPSWPSREAGEVTLLSAVLHNRPGLLSAGEGAGVGEREARGSNYRLHNAACAVERDALGGWALPIRAEAWEWGGGGESLEGEVQGLGHAGQVVSGVLSSI